MVYAFTLNGCRSGFFACFGMAKCLKKTPHSVGKKKRRYGCSAPYPITTGGIVYAFGVGTRLSLCGCQPLDRADNVSPGTAKVSQNVIQ